MTPELNWLSDPTVFAVNRLDAHSDHVCYRTVQEAAQRHSSLRQPLDGMWRFVWSSCPAQRPADFWCNTPTRCTRGMDAVRCGRRRWI